jgi:hypothetical protein
MQKSAKTRTSEPVVGSRIRAASVVVLVLLLFGGAAEEETEHKRPPGGKGRASVEELRVYVDEVKPERVYTVRFKEPLRWKYLNDYFVIMESRSGPHLVELAWECKDLQGGIYADMADRREKRGILRANIDTIRGCRIESFYKLPAPKAVEADVESEPE